MSCRSHRCDPSTIIAPTTRIDRNFFVPQLVDVVHPIEIVNHRHCVPVFRHCCRVFEREADSVLSTDTPATVSHSKSKKKKRTNTRGKR